MNKRSISSSKKKVTKILPALSQVNPQDEVITMSNAQLGLQLASLQDDIDTVRKNIYDMESLVVSTALSLFVTIPFAFFVSGRFSLYKFNHEFFYSHLYSEEKAARAFSLPLEEFQNNVYSAISTYQHLLRDNTIVDKEFLGLQMFISKVQSLLTKLEKYNNITISSSALDLLIKEKGRFWKLLANLHADSLAKEGLFEKAIDKLSGWDKYFNMSLLNNWTLAQLSFGIIASGIKITTINPLTNVLLKNRNPLHVTSYSNNDVTNREAAIEEIKLLKTGYNNLTNKHSNYFKLFAFFWMVFLGYNIFMLPDAFQEKDESQIYHFISIQICFFMLSAMVKISYREIQSLLREKYVIDQVEQMEKDFAQALPSEAVVSISSFVGNRLYSSRIIITLRDFGNILQDLPVKLTGVIQSVFLKHGLDITKSIKSKNTIEVRADKTLSKNQVQQIKEDIIKQISRFLKLIALAKELKKLSNRLDISYGLPLLSVDKDGLPILELYYKLQLKTETAEELTEMLNDLYPGQVSYSDSYLKISSDEPSKFPEKMPSVLGKLAELNQSIQAQKVAHLIPLKTEMNNKGKDEIIEQENFAFLNKNISAPTLFASQKKHRQEKTPNQKSTTLEDASKKIYWATLDKTYDPTTPTCPIKPLNGGSLPEDTFFVDSRGLNRKLLGKYYTASCEAFQRDLDNPHYAASSKRANGFILRPGVGRDVNGKVVSYDAKLKKVGTLFGDQQLYFRKVTSPSGKHILSLLAYDPHHKRSFI